MSNCLHIDIERRVFLRRSRPDVADLRRVTIGGGGSGRSAGVAPCSGEREAVEVEIERVRGSDATAQGGRGLPGLHVHFQNPFDDIAHAALPAGRRLDHVGGSVTRFTPWPPARVHTDLRSG